MKRRYVTNFIVLDTEGWADRTQPLTATEGGWNPDTAECRIGPGMWEDLAPEPTTPGESTPTGIPYVFDTSTSDLGMTAGLRINSTFAQTATKVWIGNSDANTESQEVLLGLFTSGLLTCFRQSSPGSLIYKVTRMEAKSGYFEFDVTYVSGTRPGSGEVLYAHVAPDAPGVRRVRLLASQSGTDAPTELAELECAVPGTRTYGRQEAGVYDIPKLVERALPVNLRKPRFMAFVRACCSPLSTTHALLLQLRNSIIDQYQYNGLVHSLEGLLNVLRI